MRFISSIPIILFFLFACPLHGQDTQTNAASTFSVASYNIRNWTSTDREIDGKYVKDAEKPPSEKKAVVSILKSMNPDILIVQEMGDDKYFEDFKNQLKENGLEYAYSERVTGASPRISQVILSRYPVLSSTPRTNDVFEISGRQEGVQRGFIDCTIQISKEIKLKVMGVHLKSKRGSDSSTFPSILRRREALALRGYIVDFLTTNPDGYIIIGGDFNDSYGSEPLKTIIGERRSENKLYDLWLYDWLGDRWTHNFDSRREYSQLDFLMVNQNLFKHFLADQSFVYREHPGDPDYLKYTSASDHRPIMAVFSIKPVYTSKPFRARTDKSEEKAIKKAESQSK
ncbi:MAG: endonuclease/exonuclease/phosphatase family protein [Verrucomicrobiota bacterium]|nr:endonuclease/exonuclease/phosphatase family protein [Verrucomicrobiota bacterium]